MSNFALKTPGCKRSNGFARGHMQNACALQRKDHAQMNRNMQSANFAHAHIVPFGIEVASINNKLTVLPKTSAAKFYGENDRGWIQRKTKDLPVVNLSLLPALFNIDINNADFLNALINVDIGIREYNMYNIYDTYGKSLLMHDETLIHLLSLIPKFSITMYKYDTIWTRKFYNALFEKKEVFKKALNEEMDAVKRQLANKEFEKKPIVSRSEQSCDVLPIVSLAERDRPLGGHSESSNSSSHSESGEQKEQKKECPSPSARRHYHKSRAPAGPGGSNLDFVLDVRELCKIPRSQRRRLDPKKTEVIYSGKKGIYYISRNPEGHPVFDDDEEKKCA